jgi:hypothetical protein
VTFIFFSVSPSAPLSLCSEFVFIFAHPPCPGTEHWANDEFHSPPALSSPRQGPPARCELVRMRPHLRPSRALHIRPSAASPNQIFPPHVHSITISSLANTPSPNSPHSRRTPLAWQAQLSKKLTCDPQRMSLYLNYHV